MTDAIPATDGSSPQRREFDGPPPTVIDVSRRYTAEVVTSKGTMVIALDPIAAPRATNSFVFLSRWHYFDGVVFHRVIPGFVVQGGDPTGTGRGGPGYRFEDELPKPGRYEVGSLAMANAGPDTNGSQFFVVTADACPWLDGKHTVFGQVTSGMDVIDAISAVDRDARDKPREDVVIERVDLDPS